MSSKAKKSGRSPRGKKGAAESGVEETKAPSTTASSTSVYNAPTVKDILEDALTKVSLEYWAPGSQKKKDFDSAVITKIYNDEIGAQTASTSRLMLLELSFYLEKYVHCSELLFVIIRLGNSLFSVLLNACDLSRLMHHTNTLLFCSPATCGRTIL